MNPKRTKTVIDENHDGENRQQEICFISTGKQQQRVLRDLSVKYRTTG